MIKRNNSPLSQKRKKSFEANDLGKKWGISRWTTKTKVKRNFLSRQKLGKAKDKSKRTKILRGTSCCDHQQKHQRVTATSIKVIKDPHPSQSFLKGEHLCQTN